MFRSRGSGILLHITSLPSRYGIGDLGRGAREFVDFLVGCGCSFWQILPLNPTATSHGNSPYSSFSAFAGNPLLISPDLLVENGYLSQEELRDYPTCSDESVDYELVAKAKRRMLEGAFNAIRESLGGSAEFRAFCTHHEHWLDDYALFVALKEHFGGASWAGWPSQVRDRDRYVLMDLSERLNDRILREKFFQFLFFSQWASLKAYCKRRNIQIIGDIPVYVTHDSADVWANRRAFKLDDAGNPLFVSGVPPDYFSATGQLWGNPVYNWEALREVRYDWWIRRFEHNLSTFDIFRIDHFRGFVAYWEVDASEMTALNGRWVEAPVDDFFRTLFRHFPQLPVIAEDLGFITPDVREKMQVLGLPGMRVLLFAFGGDLAFHPYVPHNYIRNCVAYTGTHDNNTIRGWFRGEASKEERDRFFAYVGREVPEGEIHWEMVRVLMASVANVVIVPVQDVLGLPESGRMNLPSSPAGNWCWRLLPNELTESVRLKMHEFNVIYGRI